MASWNKGIETTPDNPGDSEIMRWIQEHRNYDKDYCLIWPFSRARSGYGSYGRGANTFYVHRYMCEYRNGPAPSSKHHAAHSCDRGQDGCVNPRHLDWKTNSENQLDRRGKKTNRPGALTSEQVVEIIDGKDTELARHAAERFGVSETTIRQIRTGKIGNGRKGYRYFTAAEKAAINAQILTRPIAEIAAEYGCGMTALYRMRREARSELTSAE